ncbi:hypothetical protein, partial [Nitrosomonas nitrosa]|uniref:hypothetical protein n=1 Tax=Nitrosomonas nitrosa TaxID=52442 RepID=UPI001C4302B5
TVDMFACNTPANRTPHTVISPFSQLLASIILSPFYLMLLLILIPFPLILSRASRHNPLYFFYSSKSLNKPTFLSIAMSRFLEPKLI